MHDLRQLRTSIEVPTMSSRSTESLFAFRQVKLPDYSSREIVRDRLRLAVREGAGGFHLSTLLSLQRPRLWCS